MTTPSAPNPISMSDVNIELGNSPTNNISLNDAIVRALAGVSFATPGTTISMNDLRGKTAPVFAPPTSGTVINSPNGYRYHVFTSPGTFQATRLGPGSVEYLVVAGGGAGGSIPYPLSGGGGAGGVRSGTLPISVSPGSYTVTVGTSSPSNGNPSVFGPIISTGGGRGGSGGPIPNPGSPGGSGGGGGAGGPLAPGGTGNTPATTPSQGNPGGYGGTGLGPPGGGGGGAGGSGATGGPGDGAGGAASPFPNYSSTIISPAIPAPVQPTWIPAVGPTGLYGKGGSGGYNPAGVNFTGGGGGGGGGGGTGIVIIRYVYPTSWPNI